MANIRSRIQCSIQLLVAISVIFGFVIAAVAQSIEIFVVDSGNNSLYKLDPSVPHQKTTLDPSITLLGGTAVDPANGDIFYTINDSDPNGKIKRANKDGTNPTEVSTGLNFPTSIAFSASTDQLFFIVRTINSEPAIYKVHKTGVPVPEFLYMGVPPNDGPVDLAVDDLGLYVYWTDSRGQSIRRIPVGGGSEEVIVTGLGTVSGIAVDTINNRVYWLNQTTTNVEFADLTATFPTTAQLAADSVTIGQGGLAVDVRKNPVEFYWSNKDTSVVGMAAFANTPSSLLESVDGAIAPIDLAILQPTITPTATATSAVTATPTATPTPSTILMPGTTIDTPPEAEVAGKTVTLTLQNFTSVVLNSPAKTGARKALLAKAAAGTLQLRYDVRLTAPKKRDNRSALTKRNEITFKNLSPGNYSANYSVSAYQKKTKAQINRATERGKTGFTAKFKKVFSTNRSPPITFTVTR